VETFQYLSYAQEILFGPGSIQRLKEAVERLGWQRLMLCTGPALRANGHAAAVEAALGGCLVAVFDQVRPHVQDDQVDEAVAMAAEKQVQGIIGLGGGSPVGMAKAAVYQLAKQRKESMALIAIPTTYAGSEMTAVCGVTRTRENPPRKVTLSDPRIAPQLVIYDPELTLDLPPELTASTGINALAHCIEALYSVTRNPLSTAAAGSAIRYINQALPECYAHGQNLEARSAMLLGAHLAGLSLASVKMGLHHGLCHVLGGSYNVPHGIANSIILPYAVRFNAEAAAPQLLMAAEAARLAIDIPASDRAPGVAIAALVQHIFDLTRRMNLPQQLREAGIKEADLPEIARLAYDSKTVHNNPRPINSPGEIEELLREAW
jgi:maleylacetate reductase